MSGSGPQGAIPPADHEEVKGPRAGLRVTGAREKRASGMRMRPPAAVFACGQWLVPAPLPPRPAAPSAPHPSLPARLSLLGSVLFIPGPQTQPTGLPTSWNPGAAAWHPVRSVPTPGCSGRCRPSPVTPLTPPVGPRLSGELLPIKRFSGSSVVLLRGLWGW